LGEREREREGKEEEEMNEEYKKRGTWPKLLKRKRKVLQSSSLSLSSSS